MLRSLYWDQVCFCVLRLNIILLLAGYLVFPLYSLRISPTLYCNSMYLISYFINKICKWNSRCFEDIERSIPDFNLFFFRTLLDWLFALQKQSFPSLIDFLDSCHFCIWFVGPLYTPCVLGCLFFYINKTYYLSNKTIFPLHIFLIF